MLSLAKGFRGRGKNCIRVARERVEKALQYAYRDRKTKKRDMRSLWIQRVNAASKEHGVSPLITCGNCTLSTLYTTAESATLQESAECMASRSFIHVSVRKSSESWPVMINTTLCLARVRSYVCPPFGVHGGFTCKQPTLSKDLLRRLWLHVRSSPR